MTAMESTASYLEASVQYVALAHTVFDIAETLLSLHAPPFIVPNGGCFWINNA